MKANSISTTISKLEELARNGYVFRGHENFLYQLIPNAFRECSIAKMKKEFCMDFTALEKKWFNSKEIKECTALWTSSNLNLSNHRTIERLKQYCLHLMLFNHSLHTFATEHPNKVSEQDKALVLSRGTDYWNEITFQHIFESYFPTILNRYSTKDGALLQKASPSEDLTVLGETLPQHYGIPTAALDWSYNFYIAIYFALGENSKKNSKFLTLYALKILDSQSSPIKMIGQNMQIRNIRADRQEGTFSYFTEPCSFFLQNGFFPSVNHFEQRYKNQLDTRRFKLEHFLIERTDSNRCNLKELLNEQKIDQSSLFPDLEGV